MGVWGTGIFQDDNACDIRDSYKDYIGQGLTGPQATAAILADFRSLLDDPREASVAWLALVAVQWKLGRLEAETRDRALQIIDSGDDLKRWDADAKDKTKRRIVLEKLRVQISSPQPPEKKVARERKCECDWQVGELVAYRLDSGRQILLRVIGHKTDKGGTYPYCELLDWIGSELPSNETLHSLEARRGKTRFGDVIKKLMIVGMNRKWAARAQRLNLQTTPSETAKPPAAVVHWKEMERISKEWFQLE